MFLNQEKKVKSSRWYDASENNYFLETGVVSFHSIQFRVQRKRGAPALAFDQGEKLFLSHKNSFYTVVVSSFTPHSRCGSVIAASGLLTLDLQEDVAQALTAYSYKYDFETDVLL